MTGAIVGWVLAALALGYLVGAVHGTQRAIRVFEEAQDDCVPCRWCHGTGAKSGSLVLPMTPPPDPPPDPPRELHGHRTLLYPRSGYRPPRTAPSPARARAPFEEE